MNLLLTTVTGILAIIPCIALGAFVGVLLVRIMRPADFELGGVRNLVGGASAALWALLAAIVLSDAILQKEDRTYELEYFIFLQALVVVLAIAAVVRQRLMLAQAYAED